MRKLLLFSAFLFLLNDGHSQVRGLVGTAGISATFGSKVNRLGLMAGFWAFYENFQLNVYGNSFYCFNSFGPNTPRWESQLNLGLLGSFGPHRAFNNDNHARFYSPVSNFTGRQHSLTYILKFYFDNIGTSQPTAIAGLGTGRTSFFMENDLLILRGSDKYRTGAVSVLHQYQDFRFGATALLWTGNNRAKEAVKVRGEQTDYPSEFGYYDLSETKFGKHSHGIFALQADYQLPYRQALGLRAGVDAEQVRHIIQNKILHDMPFLPRIFNKPDNPHFPMLDEEGKPYLFKEDQKIRKPVFFGDVSLNPTLTY
jgi:hypothetical protein